MKAVYSIYLSEDGLFPYVATNIKALFNLIEKTQYEPLTIQANRNLNQLEAKYSYNNLVKCIRNAQKNDAIVVAYIKCKSGTIILSELLVASK